MDIWEQTNWFAIQTKPCREDLAAMNIRRLGLDVFLPKVNHTRVINGVARTSSKPLFRSYFFVRFCPRTFQHLIQFARGVRRIVGTGNTALPVDEEIIQLIRARISSTVEEPHTGLRMGERVVIKEGPLQGLEGVLINEYDDQQRVHVLLHTIEFQAKVLIEKWKLRRAEITSNP
jgi:transcription elongation factor/antiterminator RfaH